MRKQEENPGNAAVFHLTVHPGQANWLSFNTMLCQKIMNEIGRTVWIFHSSATHFSGGVFSDARLAEEWIARHGLTGVLTEYPLNRGAYDWAIDSGLFSPKTEKQKTPKFIGGFTSASQNHIHFEDGSKA
jgi:hypothetical protein